MFQKFVNCKKLGEFSFYEIYGSPLNVDTYVTNGSGHAFYSEEYYFGAPGYYYQYYFMLLDYGIFKKENINDTDISFDAADDEEEKEIIANDTILVSNRKQSYPNTFGICRPEYIKEVYNMISVYYNFDFNKLYHSS